MAVKTATQLPVLNPNEILELAERRKETFAERDQLYEVYEKYYRGLTDKGGPSVLAMNQQGRPLLRLSERGGESERNFKSQRLAPIVDDGAALLGRMPQSRVEPPDQSPQGLEKGELLTKYLISTQELSAMDRQQAEAGYHLCGLGDACYLLEVDPEIRRVTWTVTHPGTAYPSFMYGYKRFEVLDMIVRYYMDPYAAKAQWGFMPKPGKDNKRACVTLYISPQQRTILVGKEDFQRVAHIEWSLDFCPAVWVFNKVNGRFANSDIGQSLVQQDALDFTWAVFLDGIVQNTYPIIAIRNPVNVGQDPPTVGPGAPPVILQQDGAIQVERSQGDLASITYGMSSLVNDIYAATGSSQLRQEGSIHASIQTGRLAHALQGPQATRVELKQQEVGAAIQRANAMTLELQEKAPFLGKKDFEMFGRFRGQSFRQTMSGKDIDGWYRNSVFWEPVTGMNLQQKTAVAYEGMVAKLWDDHRAMELAGVEDPSGMRDRIKAQMIHEASVQAEVQQIMGGAAPPEQGGGQPPQGAGAPTGGGQPGGSPPSGSAPPPTMIARPPQMMGMQPQGLPTGVPQGISRRAVEMALAPIRERLKGTVYVTGDLATQGQAMHAEVVLSDFRDYDWVRPVILGLDPKAKISNKSEGQMPQDAVRVA